MFLLLFTASLVWAHDVGHAKFAVTVAPETSRIETLLVCPLADIMLAARAAGPADVRNPIGAYLDERITVTNDGGPCVVVEERIGPRGAPEGFWYLKSFACNGPLGKVELTNAALTELQADSTVLGRIQVGDDVQSTVFSARTPTYTLDLADPEATEVSLGRFVVQGFEHILAGWDHVLFVLALVLLSRRLKDLLAVVTAFTIAHSITLACAALDVFTVPAAVIEPVIALSIVWVAVEAAVGKVDSRRTWLATFALGLVHGFGFSYVLRDEIGLPTGALVPALLAFNLGVELGQLCIVAAVFPVRHWLRGRPWERRVVVGTALVIGLIASWWFLQRTVI